MAAYPPGPSRLAQLPDLAGGQAPGDLAYLVDVSLGTNAGDPSDVKSTLNDLFAEYTKNVTERTSQFSSSDGVRTVSDANKGKIGYSQAAQSWVVSENGGAYQNLLKGVGVATRVAFWSAADELSSNSDFYWDNVNERLGIGVGSTPDGPLDVLADGTALAQQWRQNAGPLRVQMVLDNVPEASLGTTTNHTFHLLTNNLQRVTVENGGLVGINKTSVVQAQLQVVSQDATTETLILNSAPSPSVNIAEFYNDNTLRFAFSPAANLGIGLSGAGGATGSITLNGVTSGAVTMTVAAAAGTWTLTLPTNDGNANQFLQTDGSGVTSWATAVTGPASPVNSVQFNDAGAFGGDSAFLWDKTNDRLLLGVSVASGQAPIDVLADGTALAQQWRQNGGTLRVQMVLDNVPEASLGTTTNHTFHLLSNNLQRVTVENGGRVGINKSSVVQAQLQVVSLDATTETLILNTAPSPSVNVAEFYNDNSLRFAFTPAGNLTLGLAGGSGATGSLTFSVNGDANTTTLRGGSAPVSTIEYQLPNDDPAPNEFLKVTSFAAGVAVLEWAAGSGGTTINPTNTLIPARFDATTFIDSQLINLSSAITELRNITTGTTAQSFNIYGTAANNTASAPTEYVRANHSASSTAISMTAQIATPSTTAVAGINVNITASAAVAGASVAGAAAGGSVTITAGAAARLTSGNANGGDIFLVSGAGIGTGVAGQIIVNTANNSAARPAFVLSNTSGTNGSGFWGSGSAFYYAAGGLSRYFFSSSGFIGRNDSQYMWASGDPSSGADTGLARLSAAVIRSTNGSTGLGSILIGNSTDTLTGNFTVMSANAATNSIVTVARLGVNSTGTAADGFGAALSWSAETSTTNDTETGRENVFWTTATHASRTSALSFTLVNNASLTESMRLSTPQNTPASPFVLSVYDGTAPNVWTSGTFAAKLYLTTPTLRPAGVVAHFSATGGDSPSWQFLRGRGTNASPTAIQNSDGIGDLEWWGQTSTTTNSVVAGARIRVSATENWSAGNNGCQMIFFVSNNTSTITDRMYLKETGTLRIGATAGSYNTTTLLQIGGYASWNTDVVAAIYSGANGTKALQLIGTNGQTANMLEIYRDSLTPNLLTLAASGVLSLRAGLNTGTTVARVGGTIWEDLTPVSNSGAGETNLMTRNVAGNVLGTDNDYLDIDAWGEIVAPTGNVTIKMYFGATVIFNTTAVGFAAGAWRLQARVYRGSATTQVAITSFTGETAILNSTAQVAAPGETMSGAITVKCTGQAAASDEVFQEGFTIKWNPASN